MKIPTKDQPKTHFSMPLIKTKLSMRKLPEFVSGVMETINCLHWKLSDSAGLISYAQDVLKAKGYYYLIKWDETKEKYFAIRQTTRFVVRYERINFDIKDMETGYIHFQLFGKQKWAMVNSLEESLSLATKFRFKWMAQLECWTLNKTKDIVFFYVEEVVL